MSISGNRIVIGIGIVLLIVLGAAQLFKREFIRLGFMLTLTAQPGMVEKFRSMTQVFDYRTVRRVGPPFRISYESKSLPHAYAYEGSTHDLSRWIEKTVTSGIVIIHNGKIAFERYYRGNSANSHWISWSLGHPFVSALVGVALEEGLIRRLSDPVGDYVPSLRATAYGTATLQQLLQFTTGIGPHDDEGNPCAAFGGLCLQLAFGGEIDDYVRSLQRESSPGTFNPEGDMSVEVLGMILRQATGRSLTAYMQEKLWSRMGAESDAYWIVDGKGAELACCGLNVVLRDYARFGLLYLNQGKNFRGQQILPSAWITQSVTPAPGRAAETDIPGYGYQWWLPQPAEGDFCAIGRYGQFIYVHPRHRVVIAKTSADADQPSAAAIQQESMAAFRAIAVHMDRQR